jgi:transcriptional regulator, LysR family
MTINASDKRLRKFVLEELKQMSQKSIKQIEDDY